MNTKMQHGTHRNVELEFSPQQMKAVDFADTNEFMMLSSGGIRSGKSFSSLFGFYKYTRDPARMKGGMRIRQMIKDEGADPDNDDLPGYLNMIVVPSIALMYNSIMTEFQRFAGADGLSVNYSVSRSLLLIGKRDGREWTDGTAYLVVAGQDIDTHYRFMGQTIHSIYIDEATLLHENTFKQALGRCSYYDSKVFAATNPGQPRHYIKEDYIDKDLIDRFETFTLDDNPWLHEEVKERNRRLYVPGSLDHQRYIEGKWVLAEGSVYRSYITVDDQDLEGINDRIEKLWVSHDHGLSRDPAVFLFIGEVKPTYMLHHHMIEGSPLVETKYIILSELSFLQKEVNEPLTDDYILDRLIAHIVKDMPHHYGNSVHFVNDHAAVATNYRHLFNKCRGEIGRKLRKPFLSSVATNQVLRGITNANGLLTSGLVAIHENADGLLKEMGGYVWSDVETKEEHPEDGDDHYCDAMRYGLMKFSNSPGGKLRYRK